MAGDLGKANIKLTGILGAAKAAVLKFKNAIMLLGAGGAAVGAVLFLISVWKKLNAELEKTLKLQEKLNEQNRVLIDKARSFRVRIVEAVEAGTIAPPTQEEFARGQSEFRRLTGSVGVSPPVAFQIVTNQREPLSPAAEQLIAQDRGFSAQRQRIGQEVLKGKTLGTADEEFLVRRTNQSSEEVREDVKQLQNVIRFGQPGAPGMFGGTRPISPGECEELEAGDLFRLAQELRISRDVQSRLRQRGPIDNQALKFSNEDLRELQELLNTGDFGLNQGIAAAKQLLRTGTTRGGIAGSEASRRKGLKVLEFAGLDDEFEDRFPEAARTIRGRTAGPDLLDAAKALREAAEENRETMRRMRNVADRAADRLSSNGSTPRFENMAAGEG